MIYIPIRAYDNYVFANIVVGLLHDAGIDCHLKDEYTVTIDPLLSPALGGMKLMVEEESVSRALELLKESEQLYVQTIPCPTCKNKTLELVIETIYYNNWFDKIKSRLINGQEEHVKKYYRCLHCKSILPKLPE